ncbi:hypothetical protein [Microbispora amethystogenes]|uniref:Uncharacterized protein n=1 Tax=Microbispora amethystogenes TaxID=1427754 RepID=A0ABQ4FMB0_9ACTN|nr:hypothetical protein [Microbispora amethystogenes]GIH35959.1 hypothetical protein Mam01_61230 [Microbispora amethystogenes]
MRAVPWTVRAVWIVVPVATTLLSMVTMTAAATPGVRWMLREPIALGWLLLFCTWLTAVVVTKRHRPVFTVALAPVIALVTLVAAVSGACTWVGFTLSEAALNDYAHAVVAGTAGEGQKRVGLFTVTSPQRLKGDGVSFAIAGSGSLLSLERYGMAYLPKGADDGGELDELDRHLGGDWYLWMTD